MRVILGMALVLSSALAAQEMPPRPGLAADADTNDARAYVQLGSRRLNDAAFRWAQRLDPADPDILLRRIDALVARLNFARFAGRAIGADKGKKSKEEVLIDSLSTELSQWDPFPWVEDPCIKVDGVERERDPMVAGLLYHMLHCPQFAVPKFREGLERKPAIWGAHYYLSLDLFHTKQFTAAGQQIQILLDTLRARDDQSVSSWYESKALLEYMLAATLLRARDVGGAKAALARALTENLGYYPAHVMLAQIAMDEKDVPAALREVEAAVSVRESDGQLRFEYGVLLYRAGRLDDAVAQFTKATELEPYWAEARRHLGLTLDKMDRRDEAIAAYEAFLARAPKRENIRIKEVTDRIAALRAGT